MSECTHDCSSCGESCGERTAPMDLRAPLNELSSVGKVIAVVSGKGGVGKSTVTCSLAAAMAQLGRKVAVLDADITGPSVPTAFGIHEHAVGSELGIYPAVSQGGVELMSLNLLTEHETDPVIWRGPVIAGTVKQFWTDVVWGDVDYMFVDMPPGTGDVPLTVFQSLPVDGVIVVTSPQDLVSMIVTKAVKMAEMMHIPILGIVENYSYFSTPSSARAISRRWPPAWACPSWPGCPSTRPWPPPATTAAWRPASQIPWSPLPGSWPQERYKEKQKKIPWTSRPRDLVLPF